tara:strand:- start:387 stop:683 length:297 start_codon:yes stop_codon:yes gene_type:complete
MNQNEMYEEVGVKRTGIGKFAKFLFIAYNIICAFWLGSYIVDISDLIVNSSGAGQTGATIGGTIGITFILLIWVLGDIILGLFLYFTKPKKIFKKIEN